MTVEFRFREDPRTAAFLCTHVRDGAPIRMVSHEASGDWQFLCGEAHDDPKQALLVCLEEVVKLDPTVNELAAMCTSHVAERDGAGGAWRIQDETLDNIRRVIAEHGWWVGLIDEDERGPAFAYTIGLYEKLGHPEILLFGLPLASMHGILNTCGGLVRDGHRFADGGSSSEVLEGHDVRFRAVRAPESYEQYLGYGCRHYGHAEFPVLQCVWPDKEHEFPGEPGAAAFLAAAQPRVP